MEAVFNLSTADFATCSDAENTRPGTTSLLGRKTSRKEGRKKMRKRARRNKENLKQAANAGKDATLKG